jgi:hypothetical protein
VGQAGLLVADDAAREPGRHSIPGYRGRSAAANHAELCPARPILRSTRTGPYLLVEKGFRDAHVRLPRDAWHAEQAQRRHRVRLFGSYCRRLRKPITRRLMEKAKIFTAFYHLSELRSREDLIKGIIENMDYSM